MAWWRSLVSPFRRLTRRFWATFFCAWLAAQAIEWLVDFAAHHSGGPKSLGSSLVEATGLYQKLVTKVRNPKVRYTTLVIIDPEKDIKSISRSNVCAERQFLALMLDRLASAGAGMIVIDKFFGADTCPNGDPGTVSLLGNVERLRTGAPATPGHPAQPPVPIVIGLQAVEADAATRRHADVTSYVRPSLPFETNATLGQQGLCNVADDHRRLPLRWSVYPDERSTADGKVVEVDTLAFAAAKLHDAQLLQDNARLSALVRDGDQPFVGFLDPEKFKSHRHLASEVMCGKPLESQQDWHGCYEQQEPLRFDVRGRIVVIGEEDRSDVHETIVGPLMGYYLQANYLEALLDDRFLMPAWPIVNTAFSLVFLIAMELILTLFHRSSARAALWLAVLGAAFVIAIFELIVNAKVYVDPSLVTATYVLFRLSHMAYGHVHVPASLEAARRRRRRESPKSPDSGAATHPPREVK